MSKEPENSNLPKGAKMIDNKHFHRADEKYGSVKKPAKSKPKPEKTD